MEIVVAAEAQAKVGEERAIAAEARAKAAEDATIDARNAQETIQGELDGVKVTAAAAAAAALEVLEGAAEMVAVAEATAKAAVDAKDAAESRAEAAEAALAAIRPTFDAFLANAARYVRVTAAPNNARLAPAPASALALARPGRAATPGAPRRESGGRGGGRREVQGAGAQGRARGISVASPAFMSTPMTEPESEQEPSEAAGAEPAHDTMMGEDTETSGGGDATRDVVTAVPGGETNPRLESGATSLPPPSRSKHTTGPSFTCGFSQCRNKSFASEAGLKHHVTVMHDDVPGLRQTALVATRAAIEPATAADGKASELKETESCVICGKRFTLNWVHIHYRAHIKKGNAKEKVEAESQLEQLQQKARDRRELTAAAKSDASKAAVANIEACGICGKVFSGPQGVPAHFKAHMLKGNVSETLQAEAQLDRFQQNTRFKRGGAKPDRHLLGTAPDAENGGAGDKSAGVVGDGDRSPFPDSMQDPSPGPDTIRSYRCAFSRCSAKPFQSAAGLKQHVKVVHNSAAIATLAPASTLQVGRAELLDSRTKSSAKHMTAMTSEAVAAAGGAAASGSAGLVLAAGRMAEGVVVAGLGGVMSPRPDGGSTGLSAVVHVELDNNRGYRCGFNQCRGKLFTSEGGLKRHVTVVHRDDPRGQHFTLVSLASEATTAANAVAAIAAKALKDTEKKYQCGVCGMVFAGPQGIPSHFKAHMKKGNVEESLKAEALLDEFLQNIRDRRVVAKGSRPAVGTSAAIPEMSAEGDGSRDPVDDCNAGGDGGDSGGSSGGSGGKFTSDPSKFLRRRDRSPSPDATRGHRCAFSQCRAKIFQSAAGLKQHITVMHRPAAAAATAAGSRKDPKAGPPVNTETVDAAEDSEDEPGGVNGGNRDGTPPFSKRGNADVGLVRDRQGSGADRSGSRDRSRSNSRERHAKRQRGND